MAKKGNGKVVTEKATKVNGKAKADFKKVAAEKAKAHQTKRLEFIAQYGKAIAQAFAALGETATSAGTWRKLFPKAETPQRLTDYALVALGLKESKDEGLKAWVKADALIGTALSQPKAKKAKATKQVEHETVVQA